MNHVSVIVFHYVLEGKKLNIEKIQSKLLHGTFSSKISFNPIPLKKYNKMFNTETFELDSLNLAL